MRRPDPHGEDGEASIDTPATNLVGTLLTFISFMIQDTAPEEQHHYAQLALQIVTISCERDNCNRFYHDPNVKVPVFMFQSGMRHRTAQVVQLDDGAMAKMIFDVAIELLMSHMKKSLNVEQFGLTLQIIHRLLCFEKHSRVRLNFKWQQLWNALAALLRFIVAHASTLEEQFDVYDLARQVVVIYNLFVTYGDTFLPDPDSYDQLYYELIRERNAFDTLFELAKRHSRTAGTYATAAGRLATSLINIRAIIGHFAPKIDAWSQLHSGAPPSPENVLTVVRENYDTLTLKLQDGLDTYAPYHEAPEAQKRLVQICRSMLHHQPTTDFNLAPIYSNHR
ncbi:uncharacterized protein MONBRDRAFT_17860 [Monosiga brevicollis MX1]|uniref:Armadillo-like helical domain-containing protein n=1 Tax=Monosiga brevicollis TaxID=81824 RepID=A9USZ2_MONBE|nr:uncharacterized protein MONBRDRAFT_17860 [Monosiga brevicollis MX1]EDQ91406.1 predicted protein [Monosiga brevicollis MX1]|eukprot:XP_001743828.1 hypothetical protein [Monosiga brevicollis MX1]